MTHTKDPTRRVSVPGDPDTAFLGDDVPRPTVWAAREVRQQEPDGFGIAITLMAAAVVTVLALVVWVMA